MNLANTMSYNLDLPRPLPMTPHKTKWTITKDCNYKKWSTSWLC